jgi:uncharacterized membrane-anchored protein
VEAARGGGLGFGSLAVSILLLAIIAGLTAWSTTRQRRKETVAAGV